MPSPDNSRPVTLRTIAQALGISHATVSLALRDNPKIPEARRLQIQALAQEMGYRPNPMAAALAHHKRSTRLTPIKSVLAWINQWENPKTLRSYNEFDRYWRGASAAAAKFGYRLEEFYCGEGMSLARLENILLTRSIHGILLPPHLPAASWTGLRWERFSAVRFGRSIQNPRLHIVTSDQVANTMLAFQQIRRRGYERVGFVTGTASERGALFKAGFLMSQSDLQRSLQLPVCVLREPAGADQVQALSQWLNHAQPDAVLTDLKEVRDLLQLAGRRVPEDIGLAALSILDGNADAGIDQHPEEIGRVAVLLIISLLNDHAVGVPPIFRQSLIEGSWVSGSTLPDRKVSVG